MSKQTRREINFEPASLYLGTEYTPQVLRALEYFDVVQYLLPLEGPPYCHRDGHFPRFKQRGSVNLKAHSSNLLLADLLTLKDLLELDIQNKAVEMASLPEEASGIVAQPRTAWGVLIEARVRMREHVKEALQIIEFCSAELEKRDAFCRRLQSRGGEQ